MSKDNENSKDRIREELENSEGEATQANKEIQKDFYSDEEATDESSSTVPFVANNTAAIKPTDDENENKK